jgi:hypothetical protein
MALAEEDFGENVPVAIHAAREKPEDEAAFSSVVWTSDEGGLLRAEVAEWMELKILKALRRQDEVHLQYFEAQAAAVGRKLDKLGIVADQIVTPEGCGIIFLSLNGTDIENLRSMEDVDVLAQLERPEPIAVFGSEVLLDHNDMPEEGNSKQPIKWTAKAEYVFWTPQGGGLLQATRAGTPARWGDPAIFSRLKMTSALFFQYREVDTLRVVDVQTTLDAQLGVTAELKPVGTSVYLELDSDDVAALSSKGSKLFFRVIPSGGSMPRLADGSGERIDGRRVILTYGFSEAIRLPGKKYSALSSTTVVFQPTNGGADVPADLIVQDSNLLEARPSTPLLTETRYIPKLTRAGILDYSDNVVEAEFVNATAFRIDTAPRDVIAPTFTGFRASRASDSLVLRFSETVVGTGHTLTLRDCWPFLGADTGAPCAGMGGSPGVVNGSLDAPAYAITEIASNAPELLFGNRRMLWEAPLQIGHSYELEWGAGAFMDMAGNDAASGRISFDVESAPPGVYDYRGVVDSEKRPQQLTRDLDDIIVTIGKRQASAAARLPADPETIRYVDPRADKIEIYFPEAIQVGAGKIQLNQTTDTGSARTIIVPNTDVEVSNNGRKITIILNGALMEDAFVPFSTELEKGETYALNLISHANYIEEGIENLYFMDFDEKVYGSEIFLMQSLLFDYEPWFPNHLGTGQVPAERMAARFAMYEDVSESFAFSIAPMPARRRRRMLPELHKSVYTNSAAGFPYMRNVSLPSSVFLELILASVGEFVDCDRGYKSPCSVLYLDEYKRLQDGPCEDANGLGTTISACCDYAPSKLQRTIDVDLSGKSTKAAVGNVAYLRKDGEDTHDVGGGSLWFRSADGLKGSIATRCASPTGSSAARTATSCSPRSSTR